MALKIESSAYASGQMIPTIYTCDGHNIPPGKDFPNGMKQGINDFNNIGYGGPCPPGGTHRYRMKLYVLDTNLNIEPGATKQDLLHAMEGHILEQVELVGKYER